MNAQDPIDPDLYQRAEALLEPGEIELAGLIVHTELGSDDEASLHETTIEIGEHIAEHAGVDPKDTYVYSGNDDPDFGLNQHQGLTLDGDEFVWECQQLLREERFKIVFYYEADADQDSLVAAVREDGYTVESVEEPA
ncbi:DUF5778 family protein [Halorientalis halophila]|uniref:DUF5778 family protein n=1 Tax=Halorientalis halophila TaxID=3108499 RepID=UPI00300B7EEF